MIRAVVFDFDNTLEEWIPYEHEVDRKLAEKIEHEQGIPADDFIKVWDNIKLSYLKSHSIPQDYSRDSWLNEAFAHFNKEVDVDAYVKYYWDELVSRIKPFPGVLEVLQQLSGKYKLGILSDSDGGRHWKLLRIKKLGIMPYFDAIVTSDDVGANKPHPRMFMHVCQELEVSPEECLMVGDKPPIDLSMAKHLGFTTVWMRQGLTEEARDVRYPYVDNVIDDIKELLGLLNEKATQVGHQEALGTTTV